jgi:hypothetical protein
MVLLDKIDTRKFLKKFTFCLDLKYPSGLECGVILVLPLDWGSQDGSEIGRLGVVGASRRICLLGHALGLGRLS